MKISTLWALAVPATILLSAIPVITVAADEAVSPRLREELNTIPVQGPKPDPEPIFVTEYVNNIALTWGGWVKLTVLYSRTSDGDVASTSPGRDTYLPQTIPVVAAGAEKSFSYLDFQAKESRLWFKSDGFWDGHLVGGYFEMDFISTLGLGGNERSTNAYTAGIRRAFVTYDDWQFGQDWTTFLNLTAYPDYITDFIGPTEGAVLVRQPMVRYTLDNFQIALENPETVLTVKRAAATTAQEVTGDSVLPDLVMRYNLKADFGDLTAAVLLRRLKAKGGAQASPSISDETATAGGVTLSAKLPIPWFNQKRDDVRFSFTGGSGIGRYIGFNLRDDAVIDTTAANPELEQIKTYAGYVAYRHVWSEKCRTNVYYSTFKASGDEAIAITGTGVTKSIWSGTLNLMYTPVPKITFGVETRYAVRELKNGNDGNLMRLQFAAKYDF